MKIGFCVLLWTSSSPTRPPGHPRGHPAATGYNGLEVPVFDGKPEDYARLGRMLDDIGLEPPLSPLFRRATDPLRPTTRNGEAAVDHLVWVIDCTAAVGASCVGGPLAADARPCSPEPGPPRRSASAPARCIAPPANSGGGLGVRLALEAVNRFESYFANTMDDLCAYVDWVGHPAIKAMYDTFHANIEEADPVAAFTRNAEPVAHVHISENDRGVPGRGHVPWAETFKAIKESGYDGWLTIEAFGRGLPDLAAATTIWRDLSESPEAVYRDGYRHIRSGWDAA